MSPKSPQVNESIRISKQPINVIPTAGKNIVISKDKIQFYNKKQRSSGAAGGIIKFPVIRQDQ